MAKVTSKLQVTIPKALAERYGIRPGDDIEWQPAGGVIRVVPASAQRAKVDTAERLRLFNEASQRQRERDARRSTGPARSYDRGWKREDLYRRGSAD